MKTKDEVITKKLGIIESLLIQLHQKFDNFLGLEELSLEEREEVHEKRHDIDAGNVDSFEDVF